MLGDDFLSTLKQSAKGFIIIKPKFFVNKTECNFLIFNQKNDTLKLIFIMKLWRRGEVNESECDHLKFKRLSFMD